MKLSKVIFLVVVISTILAGCMDIPVKPVFETVSSYTPPAGDQGKICVLQCQNQQLMCKSSCSVAYNMCAQANKTQAQMKFMSDQKQYDATKSALIAKANEEREVCASEKSVGKQVLCSLLVTAEPEAPKLQVDSSNCDEGCGCKDNYNSCFQMCGGSISYKKQCVENCR
jgi:hypothetical protein